MEYQATATYRGILCRLREQRSRRPT
jgi:hypothetical protein